MRFAALQRLGPAQVTVVPWAFWLVPHLSVGMIGKRGAFTQSTNQGHIAVATCRCRRLRRISGTLCEIQFEENSGYY